MMYCPSSGAITEVNPSRRTSAASSLTPSSKRFAFRIATYGSNSKIPSRWPSTSAEIRSPFLAATTK